MKKVVYSIGLLVLIFNMAYAKPVPVSTAQQVAENFYKQNSTKELSYSTLVHTEVSVGQPVYYIFDINTNDGYVIVAAEDVAHPIIGYSTINHFVVPKSSENTNIGFWLKSYATGINILRGKGRIASGEIALEWEKYIKNKPELIKTVRLTNHNSAYTTGTPIVGPLCQTIWNQSPIYNAMCPGGSGASKAVTGCVATAMAQIMRYWSYPTTGVGSSSYCDCTSNGYSDNYGTLSANYGATTYSWSAMPYNINTPNTAVATLMYHCGVSVDMDYDPSGSGAQVIRADAGGSTNAVTSPCAQNSYVTYFKYNPSTIKGLRRNGYTEAAWLALIENDLDLGRPVQYVGDDPSDGGHTWVCDGYDSNNYLHMNWGWGGYSDGWFQVDSLSTPGFDPSVGHEVLLGIVPIASTTLDAGIPQISQPIGYYCGVNTFIPTITLQNYGTDTLTSCTINYQIDGGAVQTQNWNGSLISFQITSVNLPSITMLGAGSHTLTCYSSNPNAGIDQNSSNNLYTVTFNVSGGNGILPIIEGFESISSLPDNTWNVSHTSTTGGADFTITSAASATGIKSAMIDNSNNVAGNNSVLQTALVYNLASLTSPVLTFKAAYQQKAATNADKLQIAVSNDCGATWLSKKVISASTLASLAGGASIIPYVPSSTEFTTYTIALNSVASSPNVMFRWEFYSDPTGPGNNLYIDDINIIDGSGASPSSSGIKQITGTDSDINIYPNPAKDMITIEGLSTNKMTEVGITDLLGRIIKVKTTTSSSCSINVSDLNAGVYLISFISEGQYFSKKIVVQ